MAVFKPMIMGEGGPWKEVDRSYIAEHMPYGNKRDFLIAVYTTDFPDQPMIIPVSDAFLIGDAYNGMVSKCWLGAGSENPRSVYLLSTYEVIIMTSDPDMMEEVMYLQIDSASVANDTIPDGWSIKYFVYEG